MQQVFGGNLNNLLKAISAGVLLSASVSPALGGPTGMDGIARFLQTYGSGGNGVSGTVINLPPQKNGVSTQTISLQAETPEGVAALTGALTQTVYQEVQANPGAQVFSTILTDENEPAQERKRLEDLVTRLSEPVPQSEATVVKLKESDSKWRQWYDSHNQRNRLSCAITRFIFNGSTAVIAITVAHVLPSIETATVSSVLMELGLTIPTGIAIGSASFGVMYKYKEAIRFLKEATPLSVKYGFPTRTAGNILYHSGYYIRWFELELGFTAIVESVMALTKRATFPSVSDAFVDVVVTSIESLFGQGIMDHAVTTYYEVKKLEVAARHRDRLISETQARSEIEAFDVKLNSMIRFNSILSAGIACPLRLVERAWIAKHKSKDDQPDPVWSYFVPNTVGGWVFTSMAIGGGAYYLYKRPYIKKTEARICNRLLSS